MNKRNKLPYISMINLSDFISNFPMQLSDATSKEPWLLISEIKPVSRISYAKSGQ